MGYKLSAGISEGDGKQSGRDQYAHQYRQHQNRCSPAFPFPRILNCECVQRIQGHRQDDRPQHHMHERFEDIETFDDNKTDQPNFQE